MDEEFCQEIEIATKTQTVVLGMMRIQCAKYKIQWKALTTDVVRLKKEYSS